MPAHLAVDLGAESGRALIGDYDGERLRIREIRRFENKMVEIGGRLRWNIDALYNEVLKALARVAEDDTPNVRSIGIDTWGVDFSFIDSDGELLEWPVTYRDARTRGAMESYFAKIPKDDVYRRTGIQFLPFNSLYQLESLVREASPLLKQATSICFLPDIFHMKLTGKRLTEFTFATTTQCFNPTQNDWDDALVEALGIDRKLFSPIVRPGETIGRTTKEIQARCGFKETPVIAVGTHDTASAIASIPAAGSAFAYISCGTWSLMGIESPHPIITDETLRMNFTNEGGVENTFRVLKNIMGLWLLQSCRRSWSKDEDVGYEQLVKEAERASAFRSLFDPDQEDFLNPADMPEAIREVCRRTGQPIPETRGEMTRAILESLALKYRLVLEQLRSLKTNIERIHMIGGGIRNRMLCRFTANATGLPVVAGPVEATAIGNLLVQVLASGTISSFGEMREVVSRSFEPEVYAPEEGDKWQAAWERFLQLKSR